MAQQTDATDDAPTDKQAEYVEQIDRVVVDPETVVETLEKNIRMRHSGGYTDRKCRLVGFKSDGTASVKVGVDPRDEGARYPDKPHPVWVTPGSFVDGFSHDDERDEPHWPGQTETKRELERESPDDLDPNTDEFQEVLDEWQDEALEVWRNEVRRRFKDDLKFEFRVWEYSAEGHSPDTWTITHTVAVDYEHAE